MTDIKIYQGNQIGGCITVISTDTTKIVIDFGESLAGAEIVENIEFDWEREQVDAVFFTHYHGDHIGRFMEIPDEVHLYMGEVTRKVLINLHTARKNMDIVEHLIGRPNINHLNINKPVVVGDYRDHGHRGHKKDKNGNDMNVMLEVTRRYVKNHGRRKIDVLITEGTMLGARRNDKRYSEKQMLQDAKELFKDNKYVFLKISSTNVDSLATFYHAAEANSDEYSDTDGNEYTQANRNQYTGTNGNSYSDTDGNEYTQTCTYADTYSDACQSIGKTVCFEH